MSADSRHAVLQFVRRVHAAGCGVADAELLRRYARSRDEAAFELLVWRHGGLVLRVCRGVLRDDQAAEDVFQAAFFALARKADAVAQLAEPVGWLYRVASRLALKVRRADARRAAREAIPTARPALPQPDQLAQAAEAAALLHEEINRLADRYRTPVVLCYLQGKTQEDAARELGWPKGTVAGRLARACGLLKLRLTRRGVAFPAAGVAALYAATADAAVSAPFAAATARAAADYAAGKAPAAAASVTAFHLANGVLRTMFLAKAKIAALSLLTAGLLVAATGVVASELSATNVTTVASSEPADAPDDAGAAPPKRTPAVPVTDIFLEGRQRQDSIQNLKMILLAMHNYHDRYKHFPADVTGPGGQKLLSWRVAILPFVDEGKLAARFNMAEPWDSPTNKKLLAQMPKVFRAPKQDARATDTYYQGFVGAGTMFDPVGPVRLQDVTDGTSNTFCVVEAGKPVPWTKPADIPYDAAKPFPKIGGVFDGFFHVANADGAVHTIRADAPESALRRAVTRNDGEVLDWKDLPGPGRPTGVGMRPGATPEQNLAALKAANVSLKESLRATYADLAKARLDLIARRNRPAVDEEIKQLAQENAELMDNLARMQSELDDLRRAIDQLKRREK